MFDLYCAWHKNMLCFEKGEKLNKTHQLNIGENKGTASFH
jgi:hypothetical protein